MKKDYMIYKLSESIKKTTTIDPELFTKFNVKRGLRNEDHSGVLVGLTNVGDVVGYERLPEGGLQAVPGKLLYRGIDVDDLVKGVEADNRYGFEETAFLLLSGYLPDREELDLFNNTLNDLCALSQDEKMNILFLRGTDIMNILARQVLVMHTFDENADDNSRENLVRQSINLIAKFPTIVAYAYHVMRHNQQYRSLHIRHPQEGMSLAENFLYMLKGKGNYTELDARTLDLALILHAEHGGGNNSTFTVRVTSSTETDTYSSISAAIGSLKGPLHGGANLKVIDMFNHLKENIKDWNSDSEITDYLMKMLNKKVYNHKGLIYGIGHAVYTISDPRAELLKEMARDLAKEKKREEEFAFLEKLEERGVEAFMNFKGNKVNKRVCANVDFYSGFVYEMIGLPQEVYTPLFAMSRIAGWCAHRIEELNFDGRRIIRPAYKNVSERQEFTPLNKR
ncbi:MAG: citrate/2-methylcitrate synthase [Bacteroidota bacterium]|uniref:citrate/2-methylcitrate synthase n=1 Tax=Parabacteroides sp. FAFU027 TaxID=2922715 RepID=UPI001FAF8D8D|nr:citrate/2-methylcitrate synthase [Parabacteroides sp. FAFU027]MDP4270983.1 citrate/2-methylcitrate synthase [Bacteroidota bacterium]